MKTEAIVLRGHGGPEVLARRPSTCPIRARARCASACGPSRSTISTSGCAGVCRGLKLEYPHRLGADVVGEVEALGPGARGARGRAKRRRAARASRAACAQQCLSGQDNLCRRYAILGEHTHGGYAQYLIVPDTNLLPYPGDLPFTAGGRRCRSSS